MESRERLVQYSVESRCERTGEGYGAVGWSCTQTRELLANGSAGRLGWTRSSAARVLRKNAVTRGTYRRCSGQHEHDPSEDGSLRESRRRTAETAL